MSVATATNNRDQGTMDKASLIESSTKHNRLAVIFCTKNCEKTVGYAISSAKKSSCFQQGNGITIIVDGFSTDDIRQAAIKAGAGLVMQQPSNKFPGKGIAMKAGLDAAIKAGV